MYVCLFKSPNFDAVKIVFNSYLTMQRVMIWAATGDFQQCVILTSVDSDEPAQPPFKFRKPKWCYEIKLCNNNTFFVITYCDKQDVAYAFFFFMLFVVYNSYFKNWLFQMNLSGILSECQTVWIPIGRSWSLSKLFAKLISRRKTRR